MQPLETVPLGTRCAAAVIALSAWVSFLWTIYDYSYGGYAIVTAMWRVSLYYTHWSTLIAAVIFSLIAANRHQASTAPIIGGLIVIFSILLFHYWFFDGVSNFLNSPTRSKIVHLILPIAIFFFFLFFTNRGSLKALHPFAWTLFPIAYTAYGLTRGGLTGEYPYEISNVHRHGYLHVMMLVVATTVASIILGYALVAFDRLVLRVAELRVQEI